MAKYTVWWTFVANYGDPKVVEAESPEEAFRAAFPFYATPKNGEFKKYAVLMQNFKDFSVVE